MRIEHIAMYVNDLEKTKDFFVKYFNAIPMKGITIKIQILVDQEPLGMDTMKVA